MLEGAILVPGTAQQELHINDFLAASVLCFPSPTIVATCTVYRLQSLANCVLAFDIQLLSHAVDIVGIF